MTHAPRLDNPACADLPFWMFYPERAQDVPAAKAVCSRCPDRLACLDHALANNEWGIWGGTTADERDALRRTA